MQKIDSESGLQDAICQLKASQAEEEAKLKEQFLQTVESVKPINLIKNTLKHTMASKELKSSILSSSVGLVFGVLTKIIVGLVFKNPVNKLVGTAAMFGVTKLVSRHPDEVRSIGKRLLNMVRSRKVGIM